MSKSIFSLSHLKIHWGYFFAGLIVFAWPLAASLVFIYDRTLFLALSCFKLNLILSAIILPVLFINSLLIYFIVRGPNVQHYENQQFQKRKIKSICLSLFIMVWMLIGANICGMLKVELHAMILYAAIVEGLFVFIFLTLIYLESFQGSESE